MNHLANISFMFFIKRTKNAATQKAPIYLKIGRKNCQPAELSTGVQVYETHWNIAHKRIENTPEADLLNDQLSMLRVELRKIITDTSEDLTPAQIADIYRLQLATPQKRITLVELYNRFEDHVRARKNEGTVKQLVTFKNSFFRFLEKQQLTHILPCSFKISQCLAFETYLAAYSTFYYKQAFRDLQDVFEYGCRHELIPFNPIASFKPEPRKREAKEQIFLEEAELQKLLDADDETLNAGERKRKFPLRAAVDKYIFQASTGLSYVDTEVFDYKQHVKMVEGEYCIVLLRTKNKSRKSRPDTFVPLTPVAMKILLKYNNAVPKMKYHTYRDALNHLSKKLGIEKNMTSHTGRKTFADILLNKLGLRLEHTSAQLGHDTTAITLRNYARPNEKSVLQAMKEKAHLFSTSNYA